MADKIDIGKLDAQYQRFPAFTDWCAAAYEPVHWEERAAELQTFKADAATWRRSLTGVLNAAALDTGAIEDLYATDRGFTISVASATNAVALVNSAKGEDIAVIYQSQQKVYETFLHLVDYDHLSEMTIRTLHAELLSEQATYKALMPDGVFVDKELPTGAYKTDPNHVLLGDGTHHAYCPVQDVMPEMRRLVEIINSAAFKAAACHLRVSYVHYVITVIHPFQDGNGRVARAVASIFCMQCFSIPFLVFNDQKPEYLAALQQADTGSYAAFIDFVTGTIVDTFTFVMQIPPENKSRDADQILADIQALTVTEGGYDREIVEQKSYELMDLFMAGLIESGKEKSSQGLIDFAGARVSEVSDIFTPRGYNLSRGDRALGCLTGLLSKPNHVDRHFVFYVLHPVEYHKWDAFKIYGGISTQSKTQDVDFILCLSARMDEFDKTKRASFTARMKAVTDKAVVDLLESINTEAQRKMSEP